MICSTYKIARPSVTSLSTLRSSFAPTCRRNLQDALDNLVDCAGLQ
jgi:hypothetical protein